MRERDFLFSFFCPFQVAAYSFILSSIPCKAMLAKSAEQMPPWGVPSVGNKVFPLSSIPTFNHALNCLLTLGKVFTFSKSLEWSILA